MARPMKQGLDYFPFDVDFFSDKKIKRLRASYGNDGVAVYVYLLCQIYRNGYFAEYDEDLILDISDELHIAKNLTTQILNYLFSRSLLTVIESKLAEPVKVITAASVQRRYQAAKKGAKRDIDVAAEFWVLGSDDTESFIRVRPADGSSENNESFSGNNESKCEKNTTKESKEKESKAKESKTEESTVKEKLPAAHRCGEHGKAYLSEESYQQLSDEYGSDITEKYLAKADNWAFSKDKELGECSEIIRKWLEKDNVPKLDPIMKEYESFVNQFLY